MQYRMRGVTYTLPSDLNHTDTYELDRIQWLARNAGRYNPELQESARVLLKKGTHIYTVDRGEYIVCDNFYTVQQIDEDLHEKALDKEASVPEEREAQQPKQDEGPRESPTVAINVEGRRYYLAINRVSVSLITVWEQRRREHRSSPLPTTEEVMISILQECQARKQKDGSWSLPSWMTLQEAERCLEDFTIVDVQPVSPAQDPLIEVHKQYHKQFPIISGY